MLEKISIYTKKFLGNLHNNPSNKDYCAERLVYATMTSMTIRQRRFYFALLAVTFLVGTPMVILYSSGYRIDWNTGDLEKTGGIYIGSYPKGVDISVDGVLQGTTSTFPLSQGKLISRLTPTRHAIRVEKAGFAAWEKTLTIEPNMVTEARNIFLAPLEKSAVIIAQDINGFVIADSQALIAYVQKDGIVLLDVSKDSSTLIPQSAGEFIGKISFGSGENYLIVESLLKNKVRKYVYDSAIGKIIDIPEEDLEKYVKLKQYPGGQKRLIALSSLNTLYALDLDKPGEKIVVAKNVSNFELFDSKIIYATITPTILYEKDLASGKTMQITQTPIDNFDNAGKILRSGDGHIAILDNRKTLFLFNDEKSAFEQIARNVLKASFSADKKKLLYQNQNEIYVKYLRDILIQPYKKKGDIELITRFSQPIQNSEWFDFDNEHILFTTEGKLKLTELDGRDERNTHDIITMKSPSKLTYNFFNDTLYFLDGTTLKKISLID